MLIKIIISLLILLKIPWKLHVSTIFQPNIDFAYSLCVLLVIENIAKILLARLHLDVIVTPYEDWYYFLVSMERRDP